MRKKNYWKILHKVNDERMEVYDAKQKLINSPYKLKWSKEKNKYILERKESSLL